MNGADLTHMDDLEPAALDGLDAGVVQLDASGVVVFLNPALGRLLGIAPQAALGRDFFRDLAPGANLPAFAGRFNDLVRQTSALQGGAAESGAIAGFAFTFCAGPSAVRARIQMAAGREAGRYWIMAEPQALMAHARPRQALETVEERARSGVVDASVCEREPIHIPGAVQPHAALLAVEPRSRTVTVCSVNIDEILGRDVIEVLGAPVERLLPPDLIQAVFAAHAARALDPTAPLRRTVRLGPEARRVVAQAHVHGGPILIQLEPAPTHAEDFGAPSQADVASTVARLRRASDLAALGETVTHDLPAMTGFERVLVYRFDRDWNGEAVAEWRHPQAYGSLLGLHFPSSDIPAQARALYTRAPPRFVIDRDYIPAPLKADPAGGEAPLDLSFVEARSLSPIHLEYQRNLGVNGSMSASIVVDGRLWGLVIGHHRQPHYTAPETRAAVSIVADALALQIGRIENAREQAQREAEVVVESRLLQQIAGADDFTDGLLHGAATLADLFDVDGAAVVDGDSVFSLGATPSNAEVLGLAAWVAEQPLDGLAFCTEQLSRDWPQALDYVAVASGLLAAFTADDRRRLILWFKREEVGAIAWGGDPNKALDPSGGAMLPRRSFERWVEKRRGFSTPWPTWQIEAAQRIAGAVEGVAHRQNRKIMALNATHDELRSVLADKERLLAQKDVLTREIDHRVKNSLQIVASFLQMQSRLVKDAEARSAFDETYARVMSVARIHDSLYQSEDVEEVDIGQTIDELCRDIAGMAGERHKLEVPATHNLKVPYRNAVGLSLIAAELVTNALKYAYAPEQSGSVDVTVQASRGGPSGVCLTVSDQGQGLPVNWSTHPRQSGLGMKLINAMLAQIGGEMTVESDAGARFTVCA